MASLFDFQSDARVRILRRNERTQQFEPHGYFPPDASEETILNEFGGGHYGIQLLVHDSETGREVVKTRRTIDLPGAYKPPSGDLPGVGSRRPGAVPDRNVDAIAALAESLPVAGTDDLMQILKAGIVSTLIEMMRATKEVRAPAADPMMLELLKQQSATQQKMMEFMLTLVTKDKGGTSKEDVLAMMAQMKELVSPANTSNPMEMFAGMLEAFKSFREAAEDVQPRSENSIYDSIPKLVEVVAEQHQMQKAAREQQTAAFIDTRTPPVPIGSPVSPFVVGNIPQVEEPMWKRILRQQSTRLLTQAAAQSDPDIIAGAAILFAPPAVREALRGFFHRDEAEVMADMLAEIPQLAEHREWLAEFVAAAQERLFPEEFTDDTEEVAETNEGSKPVEGAADDTGRG